MTPRAARSRAAGLLARGLALPLVLAVARPTGLGDLPLTAACLVAAWFAAPVVAQRPVAPSARWYARLGRYRNTALAVGCVALAAVRTPPAWLAACDTGLLLGYLLLVDALAAGPPGRRQLRPGALLAAYGASALVLLAAYAPVDGGHWWSRLPAVAALAAAALAVGAALRLPRR